MSSVEWGKQRAVAVREHRRQVERCALDAVVFENRLRSLNLLNVLLTVVNGQCAIISPPFAVLLDGKRKTGRAVHAAAALRPLPFRSSVVHLLRVQIVVGETPNATSSQRVPGLP